MLAEPVAQARREGLARDQRLGQARQREVRGGFATFFTMAYIIVLNPIILGSSKDLYGNQLDNGQLVTATALTAAFTTLLMGVIGNVPIALAAGLGVNSVVALQLAPRMSWPDAMGMVVLAGFVVMLLVATGLAALARRHPLLTTSGRVAVIAAVLSLADLVHPQRTVVEGDERLATSTTSTVPPEGLQGLLVAGYLATSVVLLVLLSLALRDLLRDPACTASRIAALLRGWPRVG